MEILCTEENNTVLIVAAEMRAWGTAPWRGCPPSSPRPPGNRRGGRRGERGDREKERVRESVDGKLGEGR
jgi:hypothetical protein